MVGQSCDLQQKLEKERPYIGQHEIVELKGVYFDIWWAREEAAEKSGMDTRKIVPCPSNSLIVFEVDAPMMQYETGYGYGAMVMMFEKVVLLMEAARREGCPVLMSGLLGCGAFRGCRPAMLAVHMLAQHPDDEAQLQFHNPVFWSFNEELNTEEIEERIVRIAEMYVETLRNKGAKTMEDAIDHFLSWRLSKSLNDMDVNNQAFQQARQRLEETQLYTENRLKKGLEQLRVARDIRMLARAEDLRMKLQRDKLALKMEVDKLAAPQTPAEASKVVKPQTKVMPKSKAKRERSQSPMGMEEMVKKLALRVPSIAKQIEEYAVTSTKFQYLKVMMTDNKDLIQEAWDNLGETEQRDLQNAYEMGDGSDDQFWLKIVEEDSMQRAKAKTFSSKDVMAESEGSEEGDQSASATKDKPSPGKPSRKPKKQRKREEKTQEQIELLEKIQKVYDHDVFWIENHSDLSAEQKLIANEWINSGHDLVVTWNMATDSISCEAFNANLDEARKENKDLNW